MIITVTGNIFEVNTEAIVNPVNCVGVMGKGLAKEFKHRYPRNFELYKVRCAAGRMHPGQMLVYHTCKIENPKLVINFPTKRHWREKSRLEDIEAGLSDLLNVIQREHIHHIAIPALGCGLGGLRWDEVRRVISSHLEPLANDVEILLFKPR